MELCNNLLLFFLLCISSAYAKLTYDINEETGQDAYIGNIPQDVNLRPLSSSEKPRVFKILNGGNYVKVNSGTGDLQTAANLDREVLCRSNPTKCVLDVEVVVFSSDPVKVIKVQLILKDLNDNTPSFPFDVIDKEISESAFVGSVIRLDSAVDSDFGLNSIKKYEIASSPPDRRDKNGVSVPFFKLETIENIDGTKIPQLTLSKRLDREKTSSYELTLSAVDGGAPPLTGTATVVLSVTDANDNQPLFPQSSYVVKVPENVKPGYMVMQLKATDLDSGPNARIAYSFPSIVSEQDRAKFSLNEDTGILTVSEVGLDYENQTIHHLTIEAKDRGPNPASAYTTVTVKVQDVNDEAPHINVNFMDLTEKNSDGTDGNSKQVAIKENTEVGTYIAFVTISDRDTGVNGTVDCRLKESTSFEMTALDGDDNRYILKTKGELDREAKRFHNIEIEAWDFGHPPLRTTSTIVVELLDENDNDPSFGKDIYVLSVSEAILPGGEIVVLKAEDIDDGVNAEITYSAKPTLSNSVVPFVMNPKSGSVTFADSQFPLDAENRTEPFLLTVTATDNGVPQRNTSATLEITIADENDNPPKFKEKNYVFRIKEDEKLGKYLGRVYAEDRDVDKSTNGRITYSFFGDGTAFTIKTETGEIYFHGVPEDLDRETRHGRPYDLTVIAADHGASPLTDRCKVEIYLIDVNDNHPNIIFPNVTRDVSFLYIKPETARPSARYVPREVSDEELLDEDDEILEGIEDIDNSTANPFPKISIKKVNKPTLKDALLIGSSRSRKTRVPNSHPVVITKIKAKDPDDGENGRVRFAMVEGNTYNYFGVDMHTGNVTLRIKDEKSLRAMKRGCHVIKVNVNDLGKPTLKSPAWVNIFVTDASPQTVNKSEALKDCVNNSFYPTIFYPSDKDSSLAAGLSLYMIIGIAAGGVLFLVLLILLALLIKFKCRCCDKKSRTYNCKNAADPYNDANYSHGSPVNGRKRKGPLRHVPNGTVDSRSSFYSEWTASQAQMAQQGKGEMLMQEDYSEGSVRSHNSARDSGKGDSMPSEAYHAIMGGPGAYRQAHLNQPYPRNAQAYAQPHSQPSHVFLPPQGDVVVTDDESRQNNRRYQANPQMVFTSKCTNDCRLYGHGDNCWMPDSLQRPPSRMKSLKEVEELDGDSLMYQKRAMTPNSYHRHMEQMRYAPSNTPYYYDPGSKFDNLPQRGHLAAFRDENGGSDTGSPAHSQLAASNVSRQPSTNAGYRHPAFSSQGHIPQAAYSQSPIPFNPASPAPYGAQPRGKAYVNLQGGVYDPSGGILEEAHSNLSSTSSGNQHPNYQNPQAYPQQYYSQEQPYPDAYQSGYSAYNDQGVPGHYDDQPPAYNGDPSYEDTFAATNLLLSPADSDPTDYKQRLERQMRQHHQQQSQQPAYNYGNASESDARQLLANEPSDLEQPENPSTDKLSTIREEIDADEVVAGIEGLLL